MAPGSGRLIVPAGALVIHEEVPGGFLADLIDPAGKVIMTFHGVNLGVSDAS